MINAYHEPLDFEIQESPPGGWRRAIDTGLDSPDDIAEPGEEAAVASLRLPGPATLGRRPRGRRRLCVTTRWNG